MDLEGRAGFLRKLIAIYLSTVPDFETQIENAIVAADSDALVKVAHTFSSSTSNVGARIFLQIYVGGWRNVGIRNHGGKVSKLLTKMKTEFQQVTEALEELLENID